ncbi:DUF7793 family protein [Paenarthrobacter histidinolovorans]|uniref:DUF7793 family protein n=1 Tax=Paenarthrobacter histidinolovorans TaxID=43664 RepID=UPI00166DE52F|nr:STAS/SEC14 domain-containing protein [Paenarthrobacter histidinolovorans]GGJ22870.1 hypothetical protein GCM10010052_19940 [Paenarthrobacter histidinolovorans]
MEPIDLGDCFLRLEGGRFLHLVWRRGVRIDAPNARAAMDAVNKAANGLRYPLLVEMAGTGFVSRSAREVFAEPSAASRLALLGASPVDRALVEYQLQTSEVPCPTRFFTAVAEALAWLEEADTAEDVSVPATS